MITSEDAIVFSRFGLIAILIVCGVFLVICHIVSFIYNRFRCMVDPNNGMCMKCGKVGHLNGSNGYYLCDKCSGLGDYRCMSCGNPEVYEVIDEVAGLYRCKSCHDRWKP